MQDRGSQARLTPATGSASVGREELVEDGDRSPAARRHALRRGGRRYRYVVESDRHPYVSTVHHGLLSGLPEDERRAVLATMLRRSYRKGQAIFHEGDPGDRLYMIERGRVAIRVSTALGDVATLTVLGRDDTFGEQALLEPSGFRTASAIALEAVEVRTLQRQHFELLRRQHPSVDRVLIEALAAQVRRLSTHLLEALYLPVDRRVMRRLADLGVIYDSGEGPIEIPLRQDDLASMAGTTRPTANRVLRQLQEDGLIELRRNHVRIVDLGALTQRAR